MRAWLRSRLWMRWFPVSALVVALALVVNRGRGQPLPSDASECGMQEPWSAPPSQSEPPMVDAPPHSPSSPSVPITLPYPTPLAPGQAMPYGPGMPMIPGGVGEPSSPVVRIRVVAPAKMQPDKEIEYRLTVENVSGADAHHVLVRDRVPLGLEDDARAEPKETRRDKAKNGATDLLWELGTLKGGAKKEIVLTLKPKGTDEVRNSAYVQFEHGQTVKTTISQAALSLRMTAPAEAALQDASIVFRLDVTNNGEAPAKDVVLKCDLPDGLVYGESKPKLASDKVLQWKLGTLNPGATAHVELQAIPTKPGEYTCKAEATAAGGQKKQASAKVRVGEAKVSVSTSGPLRRLEKRPISYLITVSNPGTMPMRNVLVSDEVPPGVTFDGASPGGKLQQGRVQWTLDTLGPGERRILWMVIRAPSKGWCGNFVTIRAEQKQLDKARSNMTRIDEATGPAIEIDKSNEWLEVGQKANYTLRIFNPGKRAIFHTSLVINVPDELSIIGKRGKTSGVQEGQIIRFDPLEVLDSNHTEEYFLEVKAMKAGEAILRAHWTDGRMPSGTPEEWEDHTPIREATANRPR